jgi:hypothetical protein
MQSSHSFKNTVADGDTKKQVPIYRPFSYLYELIAYVNLDGSQLHSKHEITHRFLRSGASNGCADSCVASLF